MTKYLSCWYFVLASFASFAVDIGDIVSGVIKLPEQYAYFLVIFFLYDIIFLRSKV